MGIIKDFFVYKQPKIENSNVITENETEIKYDSRKKVKYEKKTVSNNVNSNLTVIKELFSVPKNNDVIIKEFTIKGDTKCFAIFYDGMVDSVAIDDYIIKSMLELPYVEDSEVLPLSREIRDKFIVHAQVTMTDSVETVAEDVNFGACAVFVDGVNQAFVLDVRNWEHRSITKPENEQSIYGPQEAFGEMLRTNTILIRKILKTEKLIAEQVKIGNVSKTRGVLLYLSDVANSELVDNVKRRIDAISVDYIISIEEVSHLVEDRSYIPTTQTLLTERPDRAARALTEGRAVLLLNGSPRAIVFPTNFYELTHAVSDAYLRAPFANMSRIVRYLGMAISMLLPGLYLAITLFHQEMLPTYLLYAISAARTNVPFPSVIELLLMDFSFEMIREAGIRMPGPLGQTLGIVGGLILGQSAVSAKIVSPIMIVIIALTGIGSFATSDYSLSWSFRILRLIYIILGATAGFFGIAVGIFAHICYLSSIRCFGVPFLSPFPGSKNGGVFSALFVRPIWKREYRPAYLSTKNQKQESEISRKWKQNVSRETKRGGK
ncbi:MAG: spore germination protein [Clostridia bacterium]|nr:spore germination protein [Clostridia bacterium]